MLPPLHTTIQRLLHDRGQIDAAEVDVSFERPTRQWLDALVRPTINLFLFDLAENTDFRNAGAQVSKNGNRATTQLPPRRIDLRYMVCGFSSVVADENVLAWRALAVLLKYTNFAQLPPETLRLCIEAVLRQEGYLALDQSLSISPKGKALAHDDIQEYVAGPALEDLVWACKTAITDSERSVRSYLLALAGEPAILAKVGPYAEAPRTLDIWGALDLPPRPALLYTVTAPMDLMIELGAPLVLTRTTRFTRTTPGEQRVGMGISAAAADQRGDAAASFAPLGSVTVDVAHDGRADLPIDKRDGLRFQVAGVVRDTHGKPLAGIIVGAEGRAAESVIDAWGKEVVTTTGADGRFTLANLRRGDQLWARRGTDERRLVGIVVPSDTYDIKLDLAS